MQQEKRRTTQYQMETGYPELKPNSRTIKHTIKPNTV